MVLRISRGVWFISVLGSLAALLTVYAALPEQVFLFQTDLKMNSLSREALFYIFLAVLALINVLVFIFAAVFKGNEPLLAWFNGLIVTLNIFFIVVLFFINTSNSNEKFDFSRIGTIVYGSVILIAAWALCWPVILIYKKISAKPEI